MSSHKHKHRRHRLLERGGGWVAPLNVAQFPGPDAGWTAQDIGQGTVAGDSGAAAGGDAGAGV